MYKFFLYNKVRPTASFLIFEKLNFSLSIRKKIFLSISKPSVFSLTNFSVPLKFPRTFTTITAELNYTHIVWPYNNVFCFVGRGKSVRKYFNKFPHCNEARNSSEGDSSSSKQSASSMVSK